jgi:hypothetical protein
MITKFVILLFSCGLVILLSSAAPAQQIADPHFDARVENPAFTKNFPRVLFDEAHNNSDHSHGRYKPFTDLLFNDGYKVVVNRQSFTKATLINFKILVIANPLGAEDLDDENAGGPAFTSEECDALNDWIRDGGALLFIVDADPFASAAEVLATRLGVEMSKRETIDPANAEKEFIVPGVIVYSRQNRLLAENSITNGRNETERVNRVIVFGGQSLKGPSGANAVLKLADTAEDKTSSPGKNSSAAGRAQGIAFRLGKGRVVMLGDAAMLSAQVSGSDNKPFGMNVPDTDNRQLALNIMHWLSGILK